MKICANPECSFNGIKQPNIAFGSHAGAADGLQWSCKTCINARSRKRYHTDESKIYRIKYNLKNKERKKEQRKQYYKNNKVKVDAKNKKWNEAHPEIIKETKRKYYVNNKNKVKYSQRLYHFQKKYALTPEQVQKLIVSQNGKCAICQTTTPGGRSNTFHVDHDHKTNQIRGMLCNNCNTGIGMLQDDIEILKAAIIYLTRNPLCVYKVA